MSNTPFKMKSSLKHLIGKHGTGPGQHKRSDHKKKKAAKKLGRAAGMAAAEVVLGAFPIPDLSKILKNPPSQILSPGVGGGRKKPYKGKKVKK